MRLLTVNARVEAAASSADVPDFTALRNVIKKVQLASFDLDREKRKAEREFMKILRKLRSGHHKCSKFGHFLRCVTRWIKRIFEAEPHFVDEVDAHAWLEYLELDMENNIGHHHHLPLEKLIKAAKRVSSANRKLISFERGFISKDGIKDREWYKHLGVAPGKWLGERSSLLLICLFWQWLTMPSRIWGHHLPCTD